MKYVAPIEKYLASQTGRLAVTYLAIIMAMTILFSVVIYIIATSQFERTVPLQLDQFDIFAREQLEGIFLDRTHQAKINFILSLGFLNSVSFICGAVLSHVLARKTLEPIEAAMEAQRRFISDASHELRTPLTALQTTNEVALRKKRLTLEDAKELMSYNVLEVVKLHELTNALLGLVQQESAGVAQQVFDIKQVTAESIATFISVLEKRNMTVENATPAISVHANRMAVNQIMTILLDNAIKYSPDNSTITINADETNDEVRISVADQGIGIEKDQQAKIFDRFYRVDQSRSAANVEGTGLGLSIAKAICDRQDMRMSVKSSPNRGSVFTLYVKK